MPPSDDGEWFACPHCGAHVRVDARFCRACGADDQVGWNDADFDNDYDDDDYDEFIRREFPALAPPGTNAANSRITTVVVILLCLMLTWLVLRN